MCSTFLVSSSLVSNVYILPEYTKRTHCQLIYTVLLSSPISLNGTVVLTTVKTIPSAFIIVNIFMEMLKCRAIWKPRCSINEPCWPPSWDVLLSLTTSLCFILVMILSFVNFDLPFDLGKLHRLAHSFETSSIFGPQQITSKVPLFLL